MDIIQQMDNKDIRLLINSDERKYIRRHTKTLSPNKLIPTHSRQYGSGGGKRAEIVGVVLAVAIVVAATSVLSYKLIQSK